MKPATLALLGRVILLSFVVSYLGVLLVGRWSMAVSIPGFLLTVAFGFRVAARRRQRSPATITTRGTVSRSPWVFGAILFGAAITILASVLALDHFSRGRGVPDLRDGGLLRARERYTLRDRGDAQHEVERWRYLTVGLLFHTILLAFCSTAATVVFLPGVLSAPGRALPSARDG